MGLKSDPCLTLGLQEWNDSHFVAHTHWSSGSSQWWEAALGLQMPNLSPNLSPASLPAGSDLCLARWQRALASFTGHPHQKGLRKWELTAVLVSSNLSLLPFTAHPCWLQALCFKHEYHMQGQWPYLLVLAQLHKKRNSCEIPELSVPFSLLPPSLPLTHPTHKFKCVSIHTNTLTLFLTKSSLMQPRWESNANDF